MKHFYKPLNSLLTIILSLLLLESCSNTLELVYYPNGGGSELHQLATTKAIDYFESQYSNSTRSNYQLPTEETPYVPGDFYPHWDIGSTIAEENRSYSDYLLTKENQFLLFTSPEVNVSAVELYSRFVSLIDNDSDMMSQYIATYIPATHYIPSYQSIIKEESFNSDEWSNFSGFILYTLISGHHVAVYRYDNGICTAGSFLYNQHQSKERNISDFLEILDGATIAVVAKNTSTRSDDIVYGGEIEEIVIIGYHKNKPNTTPIEIIEFSYEEMTILDPGFGGLIGGGGGASNNNSGGEEKGEEEEDPLTSEEVREKLFDTSSLTDEEEKELDEMLQEIINDCLGEELCRQLINNKRTIRINFTPESTSHFRPSNTESWLIEINSLDRSDILLHEMIHAYQFYSLNNDKYTESTANLEVQAYLAMYIYLNRHPKFQEQAKSFTNTVPGMYVVQLSKYIGNNYRLIQNIDIDLFESRRWHAITAMLYFNYTHKKNDKVNADESTQEFMSLFNTLSKYCK